MRAIVTTAAGNANLSSATSCGRKIGKRNFLRTGPAVMQIARGIYLKKTARYLSDLTDDPVRTWEYWLSKERLPGEALGALMRSDHGFSFVDEICKESPWWRAVRRKLARADEQEHQLKAAADALRSFANSTSEDAPAVRVPNVAGATDRPLAASAKETLTPHRIKGRGE